MNKDSRLDIRLTANEKKTLGLRSKEAGMTVSAWVRKRLLLDVPFKEKEEKPLLGFTKTVLQDFAVSLSTNSVKARVRTDGHQLYSFDLFVPATRYSITIIRITANIAESKGVRSLFHTEHELREIVSSIINAEWLKGLRQRLEAQG